MAVKALEITSRGPIAGGRPFGESGPYEYIQGALHFAVDPLHPGSRRIADIDLASKGADGLVHFSGDFYLLKPVEPIPGGRLLYEVNNRGKKLVPGQFNWATRPSGPGPDIEVGDGFLMRRGFSVAWCGWQVDVPPGAGMSMVVPEARDAVGAPISGQTFVQYQPTRLVQTMLLSDRAHRPWPARDLNDPYAVLTVQEHPGAPARTIDRSQWQFARVDNGKVVPDPCYAHLSGGFQPGNVYEVTYNALGAPLVGLSFLATRDCVSFLRYGGANEGNPCSGSLQYAYGFGASMSGRYLREMLYWGINEDEQGRMVFDGVHAHTGSARRGEFNIRLGQPSANVSRAPGNTFPFAYTTQEDPLTAQKDGLLDALPPGRVPKIIATNSGVEYWWSGASLTHTDVSGTQDVDPPPSVRIYYLSGTHHQVGKLPLTDTDETGFRTQYPQNTVDYTPIMRAALVNLDRWVREGAAPPPSQYPRIGDGSGVRRESLEAAFRSIPGVQLPNALPQRTRLDYGQDMEKGVPRFPPKEGEPYGTVVSAVDADGNEVAGVRLPDLRAPLATYTGWNLRHPDVGGAGHQVVSGPLLGSTHLFPRTAEERAAAGDPRPAIDERYASREDYLAKVRQAAEELVKEGYLLAEDLATVVEQAGQRYDAFRTGPR